MKISKKKIFQIGCLIPTAGIFLLIAGFLIIDKIIPSKAHRALPDSASEIQEHYSDSGLTGDFTRVLKARLPLKDFPIYVKNLNLKNKYDPNIHGPKYEGIKIGIGGVPEWWDDPWNFDNCYFDYRLEEDFLVRVKYNEGWVYFCAISW